MTDASTDFENDQVPPQAAVDAAGPCLPAAHQANPDPAPDQAGTYVGAPPAAEEDNPADLPPDQHQSDPALSDLPASDAPESDPAPHVAPPAPAGPQPALRPVELAEAFAVGFAAAVGPLAHAAVRVRFAGLAQLSWAEFVGSVRDRSFCFAVHLPAELTGSAPAEAWLEISPPAAFALIESMLGWTRGQAYVPARPLTDLERGLLGRVVHAGRSTAVPAVGPAQAGGDGRDAHATEDDWPPADQPAAMLAASYDVAVGAQVGGMRLCVAVEATQAQALTRPLGRPCQPLEISVTTEYSDISPADLAELAPGDILTSQTPVDGDVIVRAAGIPTFTGRLGCEGQRAVTIRKKVGQSDDHAPAGELESAEVRAVGYWLFFNL